MNERNAIEKKDAEVITSFRRIIERKQSEKERKSKQKKFTFSIALTVLAIVSFVCVLWMQNGSKVILQQESEKPLQVVEKKDIAPAIEDKKTSDSQKQAIQSFSEISKTEKTSVHSEDVSGYMPAPVKPQKEKAFHSVVILKSTVCMSIQNRNPMWEKNTFTLSKDKFATVWSEIKARKIPTRIYHVYYLNDKEYCRIQLPVNHERTRTWSRIRLYNKDTVGKYRVDIISGSGAVLNQLYFEVLP